jgi:uncharacterized protein (DUF433 family)
MLVAVTDEDARNLVACQVAKHKFNVRRTIARVTNPNNEKIFKILGIDVTVCSTKLILEHIEQELPSHPIIPLLKLKKGTLEVIEAKVPPNSRLIGKKLRAFALPKGSAVLLIVSKEKGPQIPTPDTVIAAFSSGATPEEIVQQYPSLNLADVYHVIGYYLRRPSELEAYFQQRKVKTDTVRKVVRALEQLDPERARYVAAFAYLLGRVARADRVVTAEETSAMERLVVQHGGLTEPQASWDGTAWSPPQRVGKDDTDPQAYDTQPRLAVDGTGRAWLIWVSHEGPLNDEIHTSTGMGQLGHLSNK